MLAIACQDTSLRHCSLVPMSSKSNWHQDCGLQLVTVLSVMNTAYKIQLVSGSNSFYDFEFWGEAEREEEFCGSTCVAFQLDVITVSTIN